MFESPYGRYPLQRYPKTVDPNLQAWEAADRYVLQTLAERFPTLPAGQTLVCNDAFGALTTGLIESNPTVWNDSALAHQAIKGNVEAAERTGSWNPLPSTESPSTDEPIGLVVIKIPKSLRFLEDQLARLAPLVDSTTVFIGAAKAKHIHRSTLQLFERYIGDTTTSLAKQKARLIYSAKPASPQTADAAPINPWPQSFDYDSKPVLGHANVFSHRKLDVGTRFLLEQFDRFDWFDSVEEIVDVGCGNGLLGLVALAKTSTARCVFIDSSYMAVESARHNVEAWFGTAGSDRSRFELGDALTSIDGSRPLCDSADLVLCNPPFHDSYVMGQDVAARMFRQAARALRPTGRLVVVANRHLRYLPVLNQYFVSVNVAASNAKFVVLVAEQPK